MHVDLAWCLVCGRSTTPWSAYCSRACHSKDRKPTLPSSSSTMVAGCNSGSSGGSGLATARGRPLGTDGAGNDDVDGDDDDDDDDAEGRSCFGSASEDDDDGGGGGLGIELVCPPVTGGGCILECDCGRTSASNGENTLQVDADDNDDDGDDDGSSFALEPHAASMLSSSSSCDTDGGSAGTHNSANCNCGSISAAAAAAAFAVHGRSPSAAAGAAQAPSPSPSPAAAAAAPACSPLSRGSCSWLSSHPSTASPPPPRFPSPLSDSARLPSLPASRSSLTLFIPASPRLSPSLTPAGAAPSPPPPPPSLAASRQHAISPSLPPSLLQRWRRRGHRRWGEGLPLLPAGSAPPPLALIPPSHPPSSILYRLP
ncbi:hypothetical protein DFJ73DRAFT_34415 [Zopfochytrium polystomum]|nr:hypothetical protein DFJ73DRAFT_34415 [Zopfochytrium polystomum]